MPLHIVEFPNQNAPVGALFGNEQGLFRHEGDNHWVKLVAEQPSVAGQKPLDAAYFVGASNPLGIQKIAGDWSPRRTAGYRSYDGWIRRCVERIKTELKNL
jgi:hypothetical protein